MPRLAIIEETGARLLSEARFLNEVHLEALLEANPELLALDEVDPDSTAVVPIGRQVNLAGQALNLLFIDSSGKLTAVEAKLERNAEIRRQVVAQVLEYGAFLSTWDLEVVEQQARRYISDPKTPPRFRGDSILQVLSRTALPGPTENAVSEEVLNNRISDNLSRSNLRLVIAVDRVVDPLRRLVEFLNATCSFELYLLEVQEYHAGDGLRLASMNLFGRKPETPSRASTRSSWDEARFLGAIDGQLTPGAQVIRDLYRFIQDRADTIVWGSGSTEGSAGFGIRVGGERLVAFYITTRCRVWISMGPLNRRVDREQRVQFMGLLRAIGIQAGDDYLTGDRSISFDASVLQAPDSLEAFEAAVLGLLQNTILQSPQTPAG